VRFLLIIGSVLILAVTAIVLKVEVFSEQPRAFSGKLEDVVPRAMAGWQVKDLPLAESSAALAHVQGVLNYDQVVQRLFVKDDIQIIVYVAYWEPGRISLVDAGSHNPDSCWVNSGCQRTEREFAQPGKVGVRTLHPYEWGEYVAPSGMRIQAMFWHMVNGVPNRYEDQQVGWRAGIAGRIERAELVIKDVRERGLNQRAEQMFIRLSSNKRPAELLANPDARWLLGQLGSLGIFTDQKWQ
jgi:hypothetical protein